MSKATNQSRKEVKKPKKAKLINFYGFYKIVDVPKFVPRLLYPTRTKKDLEFVFCGVVGKYMIYNQVI